MKESKPEESVNSNYQEFISNFQNKLMDDYITRSVGRGSKDSPEY